MLDAPHPGGEPLDTTLLLSCRALCAHTLPIIAIQGKYADPQTAALSAFGMEAWPDGTTTARLWQDSAPSFTSHERLVCHQHTQAAIPLWDTLRTALYDTAPVLRDHHLAFHAVDRSSRSGPHWIFIIHDAPALFETAYALAGALAQCARALEHLPRGEGCFSTSPTGVLQADDNGPTPLSYRAHSLDNAAAIHTATRAFGRHTLPS